MNLTNLKPRQLQFVQQCVDAGITSPASRDELAMVCENSGIYACPPSWITQDTTRRAGRGEYNMPELTEYANQNGGTPSPSATPAPPVVATEVIPTTVAHAPQGAVDVAHANMVMGMTGGDRQNLVPSAFDGFVRWGHFKDVEKVIRSRMNYNIYITGLSGNGKTLMCEQVCAKLKRECYRVNITAETDEDDLLGGFRLINGNTVWQDGPVVCAMKNGGVLLLDEIDLGGRNLMCLQPVLEGKGVFLKKIMQWVTPAPGFTILATANTKGKGSDDGRFIGTGIMNEAMLDRFPVTFEQPYPTPAIEKKILIKVGADATFAEHLTRWADIIRKSFYEGAVDEIVSTRRLVDIVNAEGIFGDRMKAITMCLARFDDDTREGFMSLYTKVDADIENGVDAEGNVDGVTVSDDKDCPF
jgi:hypothetical protein